MSEEEAQAGNGGTRLEPWRLITIDDSPRVPRSEGATWRPVRRTLGLTGIAVNAYTAENVDDEVIELHDERSPNAGGREELYLVTSGVARFTIGGQQTDAPAGTLIAIDFGVERRATALEAETTVIVVGGKPGAAYPPAPFEYWYAAEPHYLSGEYEHGLAKTPLPDERPTRFVISESRSTAGTIE
jgi:mannose-6-phosphate isomerase-like protein (cupin superfamily)